MSITVGVARVALAFTCAGVVVTIGLTVAGTVQEFAREDGLPRGVPLILPLLGLPIVILTVLVGVVAYGALRLLGRVSGRAAVVVGSLIGGAAATVLPLPYFPPLAAAIVGAAAGWVWWQVLQDAIPERVT